MKRLTKHSGFMLGVALICLFGCASFVAGAFDIFQARVNAQILVKSYAVSGNVKVNSGTGVAKDTITFSRVSGTGSVPAPVQTDSSGTWSQKGFEVGTTYRATPSLQGFGHNPGSLDFSGARTDLNFTALPSLFKASGKVTTADGKGVSGVKISFARTFGVVSGNTPPPVQTDANGNWSQDGFTVGAVYQAVPSRNQHDKFTPGVIDNVAAITGAVGQSNAVTTIRTVLNLNFQITIGTFTASGKVTNGSGVGVPRITMIFSRVTANGALPVPDQVLTDDIGNWSQSGFEEGVTFQVTPNNSDFSISPSGGTFGVSNPAQNFTARRFYAVSGKVLNGVDGKGIGAARIQFSLHGATSILSETISDVSGAWRQSGFVEGDVYHVIASKENFGGTPGAAFFSAATTSLVLTLAPIGSR